jgi:hypothetical protein
MAHKQNNPKSGDAATTAARGAAEAPPAPPAVPPDNYDPLGVNRAAVQVWQRLRHLLLS